MADMIFLSGVSKRFGDNIVIRDISFNVKKGEVYSIIGPNGVGKSTLLKIIAGILKQDEGQVKVYGKTTLVPQNDLLLPWMTLEENITFPLRIMGVDKKEAETKAWELSVMLGFEKYLKTYPKHASGGTRRKVAIARGLALGANIVLLDEPFIGLDISSATSLLNTIKKLKGKLTIIMVSHQLYELAELSDRVALLDGSPGTIKREVILEEYTLSKKIEILKELLLGMGISR